MDSLASILAGVPSDPTQVNPGLSPMITQAMLAHQMAGQALSPGMPPQLSGGPQNSPQNSAMPQLGQQPTGNTPMGFGSMGGNPTLQMIAAGLY